MNAQSHILTAVAKTINGTSFVGVRYYENSKGEVSNQTVLAGISYMNVLKHDLDALIINKDKVIADLSKKHDNDLVEKAYAKVLTSLNKRLASEDVKEQLREQGDATIKQSDAQIDAYEKLAKGVKRHKDSDEIHVFGLVIRKEVIIKGEYTTTNSRELTIVQNKIKKACGFKQGKYRTFKFNKAEIRLQGVTL